MSAPSVDQPTIHKGLAGVVVDTTAISKVVPETNSLTYRGYAVQDLATHCSFEQVAYLLWHGELPTDNELAAFTQRERASRRLDRSTQAVLARIPENCHPMDVVRTAISYLGTEDPDEDDASSTANFDKSLRMFAVLPTIVAADMRRRRGLDPIPPHHALGYAENFLTMCFGEVPDPVIVKAFEKSMVLYAEHSFNASTFAARVVTSTQSDIYSAWDPLWVTATHGLDGVTSTNGSCDPRCLRKSWLPIAVRSRSERFALHTNSVRAPSRSSRMRIAIHCTA